MGTSKGTHEHFNLYYIFLEDKQKNALSEERVEQMKKNIQRRISQLKSNSGSDPP